MRRAAALFVLVLVGVLLASVAGWLAEPPPEPPPPEPTPPAESKRSRTRNLASDPPPSAVAIVAPTPIDAAPSSAVSPVATPKRRPNVVLVMGCTVRRDQVTPYGGPPAVTPFLAKLAARGTVFDDPISAAPWTRPASTAILTGRHAVSLGVVEPGSQRNNRRLTDEVITLAERLSERGYFTLGITANPNLRTEFGFSQGYEVYQPGGEAAWGKKLPGVEVVDRALEALATNRASGDARPFYLRAMLIDAHSPRPGQGEQLTPYTAPDLPERIAQYRYHLHSFDQAVAHLSRRLAEQGFTEENTVFVVISDHGEGMNYPGHHGYAHGQYLAPSTNHAIWLLAGAGVAREHRILGVSSQVDLVPTLLGVIGAPLRPGEVVDGQDWSELVRGRGRVTSYEQVWADTWFAATSRAALVTPTRHCQRDFGSSARSLAKGKFLDGCFDRHADPLLTTPFADADLTARLTAWRAARTDELHAAKVEQAEVGEELNQSLEALGYVE